MSSPSFNAEPDSNRTESLERIEPERHAEQLFFAEHWARYLWSARLGEGKRVADIACGSGYGCQILMEAGASTVVGVDSSPEAISKAALKYRRDHRMLFLVSDAHALPLADKSCDLVISFETIEHLLNPEKFVLEARRILDPAGIFLISTPNPRVYPAGNPFHVNELSPRDFEQLIRSQFSCVQLYYQSNWLCSSIFGTADLSHIYHQAGDVYKVSGATVADCPYIIAVCSQTNQVPVPEPVSVLIRDQMHQAEHVRTLQRRLEAAEALVINQQKNVHQIAGEATQIANNNQSLVDSVRTMVDTDKARLADTAFLQKSLIETRADLVRHADRMQHTVENTRNELLELGNQVRRLTENVAEFRREYSVRIQRLTECLNESGAQLLAIRTKLEQTKPRWFKRLRAWISV